MKKAIKKIWLYALHIGYNFTIGLLAKIFVPKVDAKINRWIYKAFDWLDDGKINNSFNPENEE